MFRKVREEKVRICYELKARTSDKYQFVDLITPLRGFLAACRNSGAKIETLLTQYGMKTYLILFTPANSANECGKVALAMLSSFLKEEIRFDNIDCEEVKFPFEH